MRKNENELKTDEYTNRNGIASPNTEDRKEEKDANRIQTEKSSKGLTTIINYLIIMGGVIIVGLSIVWLCTHFYGNTKQTVSESAQDDIVYEKETNVTEECSEEPDESETNIYLEDAYNSYLQGALTMHLLYDVRQDIVTLYKGEAITYEQLNNYVKNYLNLLKLSQNNSEISPKDIEDYNNSIKEISLVNYDKYCLKSTGEDYRIGLKDTIQVNLYNQIVCYYHDLSKIPDEKYEAFKVVYNNNSVANEASLLKIIVYARNIIKEYVGDPDEILASTEWREYLSVEDFLTKPF